MTRSSSGTASATPKPTTPAAARAAGPVRRTRKQERRRQLKLVVALAVIVAALIGIGIGIVYWQEHRNRITDPSTLALSITDASGAKVTATPYSACALGEECAENQMTPVALPTDGEITITVPQQVASGSWQLLTIYDDEANNDETLYKANEKSSVTVAGSKNGSALKVAEVHAVVVADDGSNNENAYAVVWALQPSN